MTISSLSNRFKRIEATVHSYYEDNNDPDLEHLYFNYKELKEGINKFVKTEIEPRTGFKFNWDNIKKENLNTITSITGDDQIDTTDCPEMFIIGLYITQELLKIQISWDDVGLNQNIGNYAEEWMLTPTSKENHYDITEKYNQGNGFACVLDMPKIRLLNPARKQGLEVGDAKSKIEQLAKPLAWVNKNHMMYDSFQMCSLLATSIYDIRLSRSFPFLGKTEGGCGLTAPFGNIGTAYTAARYFANGKSFDTVVEIMTEYVQLNRLEKRPDECIALNLARMATADPIGFAKVEKIISTERNLTRTELYDSIKENATEIPDELQGQKWIFEPKDFMVGGAIAYLRKEGKVETELDVRLKLISDHRNDSILGNENMRDVLEKMEFEKSRVRARNLKNLHRVVDIVLDTKESVPIDFLDWGKLYANYELQRKMMPYGFSSLYYNDSICIYNKEVIDQYFYNEAPRLRLLDSLGFEEKGRVKEDFLHYKSSFRDKRTRGELLETNEILKKLSEGVIPIGIGMDDTRIMSTIDKINTNDDFIMVLFTRDRALLRAFRVYLEKLRPNCKDVITIGLNYLARILRGNGFVYPDEDRPLKYQQPNGITRYYSVPNYIIKMILEKTNFKSRKLMFEIDYPNYERSYFNYVKDFPTYKGNTFTYKDMLKIKVHTGCNPWMLNQKLLLEQHNLLDISL